MSSGDQKPFPRLESKRSDNGGHPTYPSDTQPMPKKSETRNCLSSGDRFETEGSDRWRCEKHRGMKTVLNIPRVVKKPVQTLNPDAVTKVAPRPAKPVSNTPVEIIEESAGTRDESSPTVLGVDIWDGKPSVVVGMANKGKTSYKVYAAGDRVDGMELRQADPITGTVVFNVGGNNVRVKADNQPSTSKAVQSVTTGVQKP